LLWLGASAGALPLWGFGCRNLALPGVYEQALPFSQLLPDLLFAELDAHTLGAAILPAAVLNTAQIPLLSLWMLMAYADSILNHR